MQRQFLYLLNRLSTETEFDDSDYPTNSWMKYCLCTVIKRLHLNISDPVSSLFLNLIIYFSVSFIISPKPVLKAMNGLF